MKTLVVYDSVFGNTEKVAQAIAENLETTAVRVDAVTADLLNDVTYLIIGSPTRGFRPMSSIMSFMKGLNKKEVRIEKIAVFDTRLDIKKINNKFLTFMVKLFGYANDTMIKVLKKRGFEHIIDTFFYVTDTEGPLLEHVFEDVKIWTNTIS